MVRSRPEALGAARKQKTNKVGTCQMSTRNWFLAPSAGDRDGDGDADANDGWLSEPVSARHVGDRHPPAGVPLYFKNRSKKSFGHRCISDEGGHGEAISTDMSNGRYAPGHTGRATISQIEDEMAMIYIGWSETITGLKIPTGAKPTPPKPTKPSQPTKPAQPAAVGPKRAPAKWGKFTAVDPKSYMNYYQTALHLPENSALDVDVTVSKDGTMWALNFATVGKNFLSDPKGEIKPTRRINGLTDAEISRLRGSDGQVPRTLATVLGAARKRNIRVEIEIKAPVSAEVVSKFFASTNVKAMNKAGLLQVKALAALGGALNRLAPFQKNGATTVLSFSGYKGKGIDKKKASQWVDYYRGTAKWTA